jgi:hypothetical protein
MSDRLYIICWSVLGFAFVCAVRWAWRSRMQSRPPEAAPRSPHDVWTGVCYKCGDFVKPSELVRMGSGGKPDKHFHKWCWNPPRTYASTP